MQNIKYCAKVVTMDTETVDSRFTSLRETLAAEIEAFLAETKMQPTPFGVLAAKDDKLLWRIRNSPNGITLEKADRVRNFISTYRTVKDYGLGHVEALEFATQATIDPAPLWPLDLADDHLIEQYFKLYRTLKDSWPAEMHPLPPGEHMARAASEIGRQVSPPSRSEELPPLVVPAPKKKRPPSKPK